MTAPLDGFRGIRDNVTDESLVSALEARLRRTIERVSIVTVTEVVTFPERSDKDWPDRRYLCVDEADQRAAASIWAEVEAAVERRVRTIDIDAGSDGNVWLAWRIDDPHWLAALESAALFAMEPLLADGKLAQFRAQSQHWVSIAAGPAAQDAFLAELEALSADAVWTLAALRLGPNRNRSPLISNDPRVQNFADRAREMAVRLALRHFSDSVPEHSLPHGPAADAAAEIAVALGDSMVDPMERERLLAAWADVLG